MFFAFCFTLAQKASPFLKHEYFVCAGSVAQEDTEHGVLRVLSFLPENPQEKLVRLILHDVPRPPKRTFLSVKCVDEQPWCFAINEFRSTTAAKGMAMIPKRGLNVMKCETARLLKLTSNSIEPLSFVVPRKVTRGVWCNAGKP